MTASRQGRSSSKFCDGQPARSGLKDEAKCETTECPVTEDGTSFEKDASEDDAAVAAKGGAALYSPYSRFATDQIVLKPMTANRRYFSVGGRRTGVSRAAGRSKEQGSGRPKGNNGRGKRRANWQNVKRSPSRTHKLRPMRRSTAGHRERRYQKALVPGTTRRLRRPVPGSCLTAGGERCQNPDGRIRAADPRTGARMKGQDSRDRGRRRRQGGMREGVRRCPDGKGRGIRRRKHLETASGKADFSQEVTILDKSGAWTWTMGTHGNPGRARLQVLQFSRHRKTGFRAGGQTLCLTSTFLDCDFEAGRRGRLFDFMGKGKKSKAPRTNPILEGAMKEGRPNTEAGGCLGEGNSCRNKSRKVASRGEEVEVHRSHEAVGRIEAWGGDATGDNEMVGKGCPGERNSCRTLSRKVEEHFKKWKRRKAEAAQEFDLEGDVG